ncbi:MAG: VanZ family protein [Terrisporobacter sp.]|uniref:VanZ family protein n=1 Tax=Terrisporobacter sp. TaxID=1965305 RepID=UPI002FCC68E6
MILMYLSEGIGMLLGSTFTGVIIYFLAIGILGLTNKRRKIEIKKSMVELILVIYMITLLEITGIIGMKFHFGFYNMNLIPFTDKSKGSILMVILNFLLFVPYGTLLPIVFKKGKWNWKKMMIIGFATTISIEALQLFGGRFAEIDDVIANTLGTLTGFAIYLKVLSKEEKLLV